MLSDDPLLQNASPTAIAWVVGLYAVLLTAGIIVAIVLSLRLMRRDVPWETRAREVAGCPLTWLDGGCIVLAILALVASTMVLGTLLRGASAGTLLVLQGITLDMAGLAAIVLVLRRRGLSWRGVFGPRQSGSPRLGQGCVAYLAVLPLTVFASLASQGVLSARGYPPSIQEVARLLTGDYSPAVQIYLVVLAIGLAPLFEETLFRGVLLPLFIRRFGLGTGVAVTSLLFAAIHFHLYSAVPLFVIAAGFSLAYVYTGSLWAPVAMHSLFNGVNLTLLLILKNV